MSTDPPNAPPHPERAKQRSQPADLPSGLIVTGSDQPGGGGTQPLDFTDEGKPIPPDAPKGPKRS